MANGNRQILNLIMFETTNDCSPSDEFWSRLIIFFTTLLFDRRAVTAYATARLVNASDEKTVNVSIPASMYSTLDVTTINTMWGIVAVARRLLTNRISEMFLSS